MMAAHGYGARGATSCAPQQSTGEQRVQTTYSDELLIDMVRDRESLFDKARPDYKDEDVKAASWAAIADTFNMRVEDCQTRWVRLRERFGRELRLHKRGVPPGKEWHLFSRMRWLERFIQHRNRMSSAKASAHALHAALARAHVAGGMLIDAAGESGDTAGGSSAGRGGIHDGSDVNSTSTAGPLWPQTFKLWAMEDADREDEHAGEEHDSTSQDMAIDMAAHVSAEVSQPSSPSPADHYRGEPPPAYHHLAQQREDPHRRHSRSEQFEESVRQSLGAMAGALDTIRDHVVHDGRADDPDELFARSLAASLRALPRTKRMQAKMRLLAVLSEYEEQQ